MTHLRKMMLEELERRNYAQTTIDCYLFIANAMSWKTGDRRMKYTKKLGTVVLRERL